MFLNKNILRKLKHSNGSIAIIVLILGIAIVLAVGSLSAYMIKDIKFTQIDEQKLKALNIAEAGISNMYLNLYNYYNGGIALPASPYDGELKDGMEVIGTYHIVYEPVYTNSVLSGYIINSKGTDAKSQVSRKVGIRISINQSGTMSLGIYDYIYTGLSSGFPYNSSVIDGPFYTEGDLSITEGASILQKYNKGPIVVKGDLTTDGGTYLISESLLVGGNVNVVAGTKIGGGPISIAGNLTMAGDALIGSDPSDPLISTPLVSPMIVMGNIDMGTKGSCQIGSPGENLTLSCHGTVIKPAAASIYAVRDDSLNYTFTDPLFNVTDLMNTFKSNIQNSALIIEENVVLIDTAGFSYNRSSGTNSLSFSKAADGSWRMYVEGNVLINGSLTIGGTSWYPLSTNTVYYTGRGVIYTTENIISRAKLIPYDLAAGSFPGEDLLVLVSDKNITFDIFNFWDQPDGITANLYTVAIAKENISMVDGTIKGTLIAGGSLNIDKDFGYISYQEHISDYLPNDFPDGSSGTSSSSIVFSQVQWQELAP